MSKVLVPAGGMNGRVPDDLPACETCVDVVYIDRRGEERSVALRADLARDFTDHKGLRECRECSKLCLPVLYEDYEGGHTEHTCYLCDFEWMVRDATQVDPAGKVRGRARSRVRSAAGQLLPGGQPREGGPQGVGSARVGGQLK